ncbi:Unknown protein sequence [Pseudomonas coronafaciens pv. oryzae]|nr:Unknown protein sequence [Pseudomonas coronafaciens pv. oryzae]
MVINGMLRIAARPGGNGRPYLLRRPAILMSINPFPTHRLM